jgi:hypothetical protein
VRVNIQVRGLETVPQPPWRHYHDDLAGWCGQVGAGPRRLPRDAGEGDARVVIALMPHLPAVSMWLCMSSRSLVTSSLVSRSRDSAGPWLAAGSLAVVVVVVGGPDPDVAAEPGDVGFPD